MAVRSHGMAVLAFVLTACASAALLAVPVYNGRATLMQVNGAPRTLLVLAVPIFLSGLALIARGGRTAAAICLPVFVVIAGGSVGLCYAPSALILLCAAALDRRPAA